MLFSSGCKSAHSFRMLEWNLKASKAIEFFDSTFSKGFDSMQSKVIYSAALLVIIFDENTEVSVSVPRRRSWKYNVMEFVTSLDQIAAGHIQCGRSKASKNMRKGSPINEMDIIFAGRPYCYTSIHPRWNWSHGWGAPGRWWHNLAVESTDSSDTSSLAALHHSVVVVNVLWRIMQLKTSTSLNVPRHSKRPPTDDRWVNCHLRLFWQYPTCSCPLGVQIFKFFECLVHFC